MTNQRSNSPDSEHKSDFARGQRRQPAAPAPDRGDFARGERQTPKTEAELNHPDFAEGQRDLPKPTSGHPDFARGQDQEDEEPDEAGKA